MYKMKSINIQVLCTFQNQMMTLSFLVYPISSVLAFQSLTSICAKPPNKY